MELIPANVVALTLKNIKAALKDINKLNFRGYNFLYLANGFYAHMNLHGFIHDFETSDRLANDIIYYQERNQYRNFSPEDKNYAYYMQKKAIYNEIALEAERLFPYLTKNNQRLNPVY